MEKNGFYLLREGANRKGRLSRGSRRRLSGYGGPRNSAACQAVAQREKAEGHISRWKRAAVE